MANRPLICYENVDIYERDLFLFNSGNWLNDSCINYWFRKLDKKFANSAVVLLDPTVVSFLVIQATEEEELEELASSLQLISKEWIVIPCTNSESFSHPSSHWSLLLFHNNKDNINNCFFHFDSCGLYNSAASLQVAKKMALMLKRDFQGEIQQVRCPQQINGFDCGVYMLLFAEIICSVLSAASGDDTAASIKNISERILESVSPRNVGEYRGLIKRQLIEDISTQ